jgi:hypothetical protein
MALLRLGRHRRCARTRSSAGDMRDRKPG